MDTGYRIHKEQRVINGIDIANLGSWVYARHSCE